MTPDPIARLEDLEKKATKAPWKSTADTEKDDVPVDRVLRRGEELAQLWPRGGMGRFEQCQHDGRLIAEVRTALPHLLAYLRALEAESRAWANSPANRKTVTCHEGDGWDDVRAARAATDAARKRLEVGE